MVLVRPVPEGNKHMSRWFISLWDNILPREVVRSRTLIWDIRLPSECLGPFSAKITKIQTFEYQFETISSPNKLMNSFLVDSTRRFLTYLFYNVYIHTLVYIIYWYIDIYIWYTNFFIDNFDLRYICICKTLLWG